jgi:hypothetical protein
LVLRNVILLLFCTIRLSAQPDIAAINDSIFKYTVINPALALEFGLQFLQNNPELPVSNQLVNLNYNLGEGFLKQGYYREALRYLGRSLEAYEELDVSERPHKDVVKPPWLLVAMGNVYFHNKYMNRAREYYLEALENFEKYAPEFRSEMLFGINTVEGNLALIEIEKSNFRSAEKILTGILKRRRQSEKSSDILYSYLQFLELYIAKNDLESASRYLGYLEGSNPSELQENSFSETPLILARAYIAYGTMFLNKTDFAGAILNLKKALRLTDKLPAERIRAKLALSQSYLGLQEMKLAEQLIRDLLNSEKLNFTDQLRCYQTLQSLFALRGDAKGELVVKDSIIAILNTPEYKNLMVDDIGLVEENLSKIEKSIAVAEEKLRYNTFLFTLIICILLLSFTLIFFRINYKFQKEKAVRLELEKGAIQSELNVKERELAGKASFINQRNEYLKRIQQKIEGDKDNPKLINEVQAELKNILHSERIYQEFEKSLGAVYPEFYTKLKSFDNISSTDMRLAAFIKMNYDNSEIAKMSGLSMRTVESQRYRLSKKLDLPKGIGLNDFIQGL